MEGGGFQKSWSVYGYRKIDNQCRNDQFTRHDPVFQSGRSTRMNLQQRYTYSPKSSQNHHLNQGPSASTTQSDETDCPFYLKQQPGLRFRSLTDSNIRRFDVNGVTRSCNEDESPKASIRQPFRQLPERIGPLLNNLQHSVSQAGPKTEKFFQKGGEKVQKAFRGVRTSISSFSQRFKKTTRRRYQLEDTPTRTPSRTPTRGGKITPGKLYSPFEMNTPRTPRSYVRATKRLQSGHSRRNVIGNENFGLCRTPPQHGRVNHPGRSTDWQSFGSPSHSSRPLPDPGPSFGALGPCPPVPVPVPVMPQYVNVPRRI